MLGEAIKHYRKQNNLTQQELAEAIPCSIDSVRRWENGVREPRASDIRKLSQALNCTEADLINGTIKQEFEVKILMGVKSLSNVAGLEIKDDSFFYGVDDEKPQIHIGGKINIGTQQERDEALKKIIANFHKACWMFDHKSEAEAQIPDCSAIQPA